MQKNSKYIQLFRFAIAGVIGAGLEVTLFILMVDYMEVYYLTANFIAISMAIAVNYLISQKWVFEGGRYTRGIEFTVFVAVSAVALFLNQMLMWIMVDSMEMDVKFSKLLAIGIVAAYNFVAKKFLVFKR